MTEEAKRKAGGRDDRRERIREEVLKAKREAGLDPPAEIPIGDRFRAESLSRPPGAASIELDLRTVVRGEINDDFLASYGEPDDSRVLEKLRVSLDLDRDALLAKAEQALERLSDRGAINLATAISDQLNLAARVAPGDERVAKLRAQLDDVRFGPVDYSAEDKDQPGGGQERGCQHSRRS